MLLLDAGRFLDPPLTIGRFLSNSTWLSQVQRGMQGCLFRDQASGTLFAWHEKVQTFLGTSDKAFRIVASCQHLATNSIENFLEMGEDARNDSWNMH